MKKGWKVLLVSCGVCAGIGVFLVILGTVSGGVVDLMHDGRGDFCIWRMTDGAKKDRKKTKSLRNWMHWVN